MHTEKSHQRAAQATWTFIEEYIQEKVEVVNMNPNRLLLLAMQILPRDIA